MDNGASSYRRFLSGNKNAIEEVIAEYSDALVLFAYCIVGDYAAAEDIAADCFATLFTKRKQFYEQAKFKTYLYKIARNKAVDLLRRNKFTVRADDLEDMLRCDSERELFERETKRQLYVCMQNLPVQYKDVLCLIYFDGFSIPEAGAVMKKTAKQVYNLLARAKATLRKYLEEAGINEKL